MSPLFVASLFVASPLAGLGLLEVQARLERWDQQRHEQD
jgi:hypothetical protein